MNYQRTHLDLFSGIGGFAIAAQNCGYTTIGFCEKEPYAQQVLKERFGAVDADSHGGRCGRGEKQDFGPQQSQQQAPLRNDALRFRSPRLHDNIFTLDGSDYAGVDLLTGGFPCQPFSVAGKRLGKGDDRAIWPEMLRVIQEARPAWIIGENVAGIVSMELDNILSDLESLGYSAWPLVIPACAVDARHRRDRVWIVAHAMCDGRDERRPEREGQRGRVAPIGASSSGEDVAHADSGRGEQRDKNERSLPKPDSECAGIGEDVAYAASGQDDGRNGGSVDAAEGSREGQHADAHARGEDVAHADSQRGCVRQVHGEDASDARQSPATWKDERDWFAESGMGRVAHGIPNRAHRLRGLGNAIVPQVAEEIIRAIASLTPPFSAVTVTANEKPR